ncbi:MAG: hypothetical protein RIC14_07880 [Filomicrobium sp.]
MSDLSARIAAKAREEAEKKKNKPPHPGPTPDKPGGNESEGSDTEGSSNNQQTDSNNANDPTKTYREGKRNISAYHSDAVFRQFKILAAENDLTVQELHREALNLLFSRYGKPPIA